VTARSESGQASPDTVDDVSEASTADIRLYAELDELVTAHQRRRVHTVDVGGGRSVKDAIESLGVPHTEVELVLVDGEPVQFDHRLVGGSRAAVYPHFTRLGPDDADRAGPGPPHEVRFVADGHVAALARYLRLLGFDTLCEQEWHDPELAVVATRDHRVLLTRDRGLLKRKAIEYGVLVWSDDPETQLIDIVRRLGLAEQIRPFTRCMACNGRLEDVDKRDVAALLEPGTREHVDHFRRCRSCGRVYWRGTHHARLTELVDRARAAVDQR
jgi:uncharacterized protein